jgi:hypothetical protein
MQRKLLHKTKNSTKKSNRSKSQPNSVYDLEAELASLTMQLTDIPGEDGPSPLDATTWFPLPLLTLLLAALIKGFLV